MDLPWHKHSEDSSDISKARLVRMFIIYQGYLVDQSGKDIINFKLLRFPHIIVRKQFLVVITYIGCHMI